MHSPKSLTKQNTSQSFDYFSSLPAKIDLFLLPSSRGKMKIVRNDAQAMMESLLFNPRIMADNYLFFGQNPLSMPLVDCGSVLGDINTISSSHTKCR
jgi:hypothetical protein